MSDTPATNSEQLEEGAEPSAIETPENEELETPAESESLETVDTETPEPEAESLSEAEEMSQLSREEFVQIRTEFGDEIAAQIMAEGGDYDDAVQLRLSALEDENVKLRERLGALEGQGKGTPAPVSTATEKRGIFKATK